MIFIFLSIELLVGVPLFLTILNLLNLFRKKKIHKDPIHFATIALGSLFSFMLLPELGSQEWNMPVTLGDIDTYHTPVAQEHFLTLAGLTALALMAYLLLRFRRDHLSPLIKVFCLSTIYMGCILAITWGIQITSNLPNESGPFFDILFWKNIQLTIFFMLLFPFNFIILTIDLLIDITKDKTQIPLTMPQNPVLRFCYSIVNNSSNLPITAFIFLVPFVGICIILLVLFGQQPDSVVKVFTETSDWFFSTKISPPPVEYQGHYLCTVAAKGHKKIVKPQRMGLRWGYPIIVNRQLCIANAFEELVAEKTPRLHRFIRRTYDKYGYPLANKIENPVASDITYILMKPLEWFFLLVLYSLDRQPEKRIANQYSFKPHR